LDLRNSINLINNDRAERFNKSLWSVGPFGPSGFQLVDRAYSSERPEAEICISKSKIFLIV
jgi:hypothetical protein